METTKRMTRGEGGMQARSRVVVESGEVGVRARETRREDAGVRGDLAREAWSTPRMARVMRRRGLEVLGVREAGTRVSARGARGTGDVREKRIAKWEGVAGLMGTGPRAREAMRSGRGVERQKLKRGDEDVGARGSGRAPAKMEMGRGGVLGKAVVTQGGEFLEVRGRARVARGLGVVEVTDLLGWDVRLCKEHD